MEVWYYIAAILIVSFAIAGIFASFFPKHSKAWTIVFPGIYTMIPAAVALLVALFLNQPVSLKAFGLRFSGHSWYYLIAFLFPILMMIVNVAVQFLLKNCYLKPDIKWKTVFRTFAMQIFILAIPIAGEEIGWRGFLQNRAVNDYGYWMGATIIGLVWGFWHAPFALRGYNLSSLPYFETLVFYPLSCLGLSAIMIFLTYKTNSMIPALILHTTNNSLGGVSAAVFDGKDSAKSIIGVLAFFLLMFLIVGFVLGDDVKLEYR
jgi:membrane protease YdiL (CAAX protease family)